MKLNPTGPNAEPRRISALIVYAHPEPSSFCAAMKDVAVQALYAAGVACEVSDLYAEQFNPVAGRQDFLVAADERRFHYQTEQLQAARSNGFAPDIQREQARLAAAELILIVFPLWWGSVPAILKGWFDRVLAYGFAYADGKRFDTGHLAGRSGMLGISTGGTAERFTAGGAYGPLETVLHGVQHCMLNYLGLDSRDPFVAYAAPRVSDEERARYLQQWQARVMALAQRQSTRPQPADLPVPDATAAGGWSQLR